MKQVSKLIYLTKEERVVEERNVNNAEVDGQGGAEE
jgi:hypothetical protein